MVWKEISFALILRTFCLLINQLLFDFSQMKWKIWFLKIESCCPTVFTLHLKKQSLLIIHLSHGRYMFVSPHLDPQDIKNQKNVLKDFLPLQKHANGSPSFKAYAQGFSIKIATPEGKKFFYPFDCKHSPQQFLLSKGINCKK